MKHRYKVTEVGDDGRVYWVDLGDRAVLNCFDRQLLLEREPPHETFTAIQSIKTILPEADFTHANIDEMADFIRHQSCEIRPPGLDIVIIPGSLGSRSLEGELSLKGISVTSLMSYIAEMTSTEISFESDAIVIRDGTANSKQAGADQPATAPESKPGES